MCSFRKALLSLPALIERFDMGALRAIEKHATTFVFRDAKPPTKIFEGLESKWTTIAPGPAPVPGK
jgi:hypothetical protein